MLWPPLQQSPRDIKSRNVSIHSTWDAQLIGHLRLTPVGPQPPNENAKTNGNFSSKRKVNIDVEDRPKDIAFYCILYHLVTNSPQQQTVVVIWHLQQKPFSNFTSCHKQSPHGRGYAPQILWGEVPMDEEHQGVSHLKPPLAIELLFKTMGLNKKLHCPSILHAFCREQRSKEAREHHPLGAFSKMNPLFLILPLTPAWAYYWHPHPHVGRLQNGTIGVDFLASAHLIQMSDWSDPAVPSEITHRGWPCSHPGWLGPWATHGVSFSASYDAGLASKVRAIVWQSRCWASLMVLIKFCCSYWCC